MVTQMQFSVTLVSKFHQILVTANRLTSKDGNTDTTTTIFSFYLLGDSVLKRKTVQLE